MVFLLPFQLISNGSAYVPNSPIAMVKFARYVSNSGFLIGGGVVIITGVV